MLEIFGMILTSALLTFFSALVGLVCCRGLKSGSSSFSLGGFIFTTRIPVLYDCLLSSFTVAIVGISA